MFYNYNEIRSHQGLFNFILSNRGGGKTYGSKLIGVKEYLKTGAQFVYARRYDSEFNNKGQFFDDIVYNEAFPEHEFSVFGYKGYIRKKKYNENGELISKTSDGADEWEELCHFIPLSISQKFKSTAFPKVNKIFFDEFIIDKGHSRYLKNEVEVFLDLFETVARKRDNVRAFFLANNVSLVNPYFTYFNLKIDPKKRFNKAKNGLVVVELFADEDFIKEKKDTLFGQLISGTKYGDYAIENKSLRDNTAFVIPRPSSYMEFLCSFVLEGKEYGMWKCPEEGILYFDDKVDTTSKYRYTITETDHTPNLHHISLAKSSYKLSLISSSFSSSLIFYSTSTHYSTLLSILHYL